MKKIFLAFASLSLCFALFAGASRAENFAIGSTAENFKLMDINGVEQSLESLKGEKGTIIVFLSAQCPVVKQYNERLNKIAADYSSKGINFIGINSNITETLERVKAHANENYKFPMLIDTGNVVADKFNANATPEIFFFDAKNKLIYHGAIDNDKSGENISSTFLKDALDSHLAGKAIAKNDTRAIGCTIKRAESKMKQ